MIIFKYSNEGFMHFKGCRIVILNYDVFTYAFAPGFIRFRICGGGLIIKDLSIHKKTLCDLRNKGIMFKYWYIRRIKT